MACPEHGDEARNPCLRKGRALFAVSDMEAMPLISVQELQTPYAVSVDEAIARLCAGQGDRGTEVVPLPDAIGRVLADDFVSPFPMPPFRRAAMDGYAVRASDTSPAEPDRPLALAAEVEARPGRPAALAASAPSRASAGIASARIYTGAPVPEGFDAIVVQEMVFFDGCTPLIDRPVAPGRHVAEAGEDIRSGERVLRRGRRIGAKEVAVLASFGADRVAVCRRLSAAVLPIGDELAQPGEPLGPHRIYEANGYMVEARLRQLGAEVRRLAPAPDDPEAIRARIELAWETAELVVTIGGVSVGDHDYAKTAAARAGAEPLFTKVRMRPGTPTSAFVRGDRTMIALSGNPSACFSGLELLAVPFARRRSGEEERGRWLEGRLAEGLEKPCPYPRYIRARAWMDGGMWRLRPLAGDKSGNIAAFAEANALAEVPAGGGGAGQGQIVKWIRLD